MEFFNNAALVQGIKVTLLFISLFIAIVVVLYNWLYLVRVFSSHEDADMHPPKNIAILVKASIFTALFTVCLIIFFFITKLY